MPLDSNDPSRIFVHALVGEAPTEDQLHRLDSGWAAMIQTALEATPANRRATLILARSGVSDVDRLRAALLGTPKPVDRPWPEQPTPIGAASLPRFPEELLPTWLTIYVRSEARATQTPTDLVGMLALAVLSTALAGPIVLNPWGDWIEPLNLYTMVVLPPGHRKSAIFTNVVAPLHEFEADAAQHTAPQLALARRRQHAAEQALLRAQDAAARRLDEDPRRPHLLETVERRLEELAALETPIIPRLITDDCSPERLAMLLAEQGGRLAILSPEGGIFDMIAGRYTSAGGAPNLDHYLKGHAGDPIVVDRVSRPGEIIPHPALTVGLAVQPEVLRGLVARPGFYGRGLLARFLYAIPNASLGHRAIAPEPMDPSIRRLYHRHVRALLTLTHPSPNTSTLPANASTPPVGALLAAPASIPASPASIPGPPDPCLPLSIAMGRDVGVADIRAAQRLGGGAAFVLPFDPRAADRLRQFAEAIEPRLAPGEDLDPIVDWASKLVGATTRIAGLLHLASLDLPRPADQFPLSAPEMMSAQPMFAPRSGLGAMGVGGPMVGVIEVSLDAVESAIQIAEYLTEHAKAAYAAMGLDPAIANIPHLLAWIRRTRPATFTRRDAQRATRPRLNTAAELDDALDQLEQHGYIRLRPTTTRPGPGRRPSPTYDVHPSLVTR